MCICTGHINQQDPLPALDSRQTQASMPPSQGLTVWRSLGARAWPERTTLLVAGRASARDLVLWAQRVLLLMAVAQLLREPCWALRGGGWELRVVSQRKGAGLLLRCQVGPVHTLLCLSMRMKGQGKGWGQQQCWICRVSSRADA